MSNQKTISKKRYRALLRSRWVIGFAMFGLGTVAGLGVAVLAFNEQISTMAHGLLVAGLACVAGVGMGKYL